MKNYTTQTAAYKATTIDTRLLDAYKINTEKLFVKGTSIADVIENSSNKGINNAVRISTTIGSIKNNSTVSSDNYTFYLSGGVL